MENNGCHISIGELIWSLRKGQYYAERKRTLARGTEQKPSSAYPFPTYLHYFSLNLTLSNHPLSGFMLWSQPEQFSIQNDLPRQYVIYEKRKNMKNEQLTRTFEMLVNQNITKSVDHLMRVLITLELDSLGFS